jgi:hypothetical protein
MGIASDARTGAPLLPSVVSTTPLKEAEMPKFVIERDIQGAGQLSADELHAISGKSNQVLAEMEGRAVWQQSYVTDDKIFCVYIAEDREAIREHAHLAGLPVDAIHKISSIIDPSTGD